MTSTALCEMDGWIEAVQYMIKKTLNDHGCSEYLLNTYWEEEARECKRVGSAEFQVSVTIKNQGNLIFFSDKQRNNLCEFRISAIM